MKNIQVKLLISLIVFALILVSVVSYVNRQLLISDTQAQEQKSRELIENHILVDMQTVDNAHYYFDESISKEMEQELRNMLELYKENPNFSTWDFEKMKASHGLDIYILDEKNTVIHTTFEQDLGFSFSECCHNFAGLLDERRQSGEFYTDGIDVSTTTGEIRKFSYLGTPDKKYLLEVGINLNDVPVFETFNFVRTANHLVEKYDDLIEVKTINKGGIFLDDSQGTRLTVEEMPPQFLEAFTKARNSMESVEYKVELDDGYIETYRFLPYEAENARGNSTQRVVYVKYGNSTELALLQKNTKQFWLLLLLALFISCVTLIFIIKILGKTINLATYDTLTGVYNRATYINNIQGLLQKRKCRNPGLLLVDLDNFKSVNDQFGHAQGDIVLVKTAKTLEKVLKNENGFVARFGGDEFAVVLCNATPDKLRETAEAILRQIRSFKEEELEREIWELLSVSIGGALIENPDETEVSLFKRADEALYISKDKGKDQFTYQ